MDDLESRHKQEKKDLQASIQKIKHAAPKGDKKRQKQAKEEIAKLEAALIARHEQELKVSSCSEAIGELQVEEPSESTDPGGSGDGEETKKPAKKSKAAKRREKKEQEEREREARIAAAEKESVTGVRHIEQHLITDKLTSRKLILHDIPSDGDCLYKAISHQLSLLVANQVTIAVSDLRKKVADQMREHKDDYLPFITTSSGDLLDEQGFSDYCDKLEKTHEWGGHVEIKAINAIFGNPVHIIQADQPDIIIAQDSNADDQALTIVYHKKLYELGEHYNSVKMFDSEAAS